MYKITYHTYHPNSHIIQTTISSKQPHCMRSYHNISDCWNTVCWNAIVYYVGYVARPCKSCDTPGPFGNCWISAINSLHAVLGPVLVCLKIAGVWTPFQCTNHSTDRGGRGGFVGKVGMSEKDVNVSEKLSKNAFEMVWRDPAKIKGCGFNTKWDKLARSFLVLIMFDINWKKGRVSLHFIGSRLPFCCFKFQLIAVVILILLSNSP